MAEVPPELAAEVQKLERYHAENPQGRYFVPLANAYRKMGALDQAEALLREGLRRHPDYLSAHIVLGRCLADGGATDAAVSEFRYVLSVDPQNLIALRSLGEMASEGGRSEEAVRWYRELLAVDPMNEDARQALETLETRPAPPAAGEGGAEWWERPADAAANDAELPASGIVDDDLIWSSGTEIETPAGEGASRPDEALSWGAVDLDSGVEPGVPAEEPAPAEPFAALAFGDLELSDAVPEPVERQEAQPWSAPDAPGGWDPFSGGTVELDTSAFGGGAEAAEPEAEGDEVVTETIAELYARQGFHDRAADVYRELIRRRGGDPALEARLREVESLASGGSADEAPASWTPDAEAPAAPATDTDDLPLLEWSVDEPERAAEDEPAAFAGDESLPYASPAPEGEDAFADSFEDGFGDVALAPSAGLHDAFDGYAPEPDEIAAMQDRSLPWAAPESEAEEVAAIFARDEAFLAPAPTDLPAADVPVADEPLVAESAAHDLLSGEPFSDDLAAGDAEADGFGAPEPFAAEPFGAGPPADDLAAEVPDTADEVWTLDGPADGAFTDEPQLQAPADDGLGADEPFAAMPPSGEAAGGDEATGPEPAAAPEPAQPAAVEFRSVREYLSGIASWQPAGAAGAASAEAPAAAEPEPVAAAPSWDPEPAVDDAAGADAGFGEPAAFELPAEDEAIPDVAPSTMEELPPALEHTAAGDFHEAAAEDEEDDMPWLAAPVSADPGSVAEPMEIDGLLEAESAGAAASASSAPAGDPDGDDDLYPWELAPAAPQPAAEAPPAPDAQPAAGFSFEEFFVEPTPAPPAPEVRAPEPPRAAEPPAPPAAAPEAGGDDEDLESFQAWLQSLKR
ncbi:MAG: tetratricopeptide repeat protein [Longimicrobiaceae bacterium]